jgi:hypothetical protein
MAGEAALGKVVAVAADRLRGGSVSRTSALLASAAVGVGAAVVTYKLLRSDDDDE